MKLRNKLFLFTISIISLTLVISGIIYINHFKALFNEQIELNIKHDIELVNQSIESINTSNKKLINSIANIEDFKSSLNLISFYEDRNDYVKEIFDFEKEKLLNLSTKWLETNEISSICLYDNNKELIVMNRANGYGETKGYSTYSNSGKKLFKDKTTNENRSFPQYSNIKKSYIDKTNISFYNGNIYLKTIIPVKDDNTIIGYIKISYMFDNSFFDQLDLENQILLKYKQQYQFTKNFTQTNFNQIKSLKQYQILTTPISTVKDIEIVNIVDKTILQTKLKNTLIDMLTIWIGILILTFTISIIFTQKYFIEPINKVIEAIKNTKENKFVDIKSQSKDEFNHIALEFNKLSHTLADNIAFLRSHKKVMDEGNIVSKSDLKGNITYVNKNFIQITGYSEKEAIGSPHNIVRDPDTPKEVFKDLWETIQNKKIWKGVLKNKKKNGEFYWVDIAIQPILDKNKNICEYIAVRHDITEIMEQREHLHKVATTNPLTNIGNRTKLIEDIGSSQNCYMTILNINNFRQINDFYGYSFGDKLLIKLKETITYILKDEENYELYHTHGDEFVLLSHNCSKDTLNEKVYTLINKIATTDIHIDNELLNIDLTAAISFEEKDKLIQTANMAMKIAKREQKNIFIYSEEESLNKEYEHNIKWTNKLKSAISEGRIVPFFQPLINNHTQKPEKYESLVRMIDTDGKIISPFFFLDIAKKTNQYTQLTKIMMKKSFEKFKDNDYEFSINLTIEDILNNEIQTLIYILLETYNIGDRVVFEIVESESIENFNEVIEFIDGIKSYKCKVAIDDFGTGYSNFEYLMKLKADYIKIDGSMIKDIHNNQDAKMVVSTIVDFAKKMDMKVIAEFVENEEIFETVKSMGIEYSQGYYFSAPKEDID